MTIKQIEVTVGEITQGYINNAEEGVRGYNGLLDIRPAYQREFIYRWVLKIGFVRFLNFIRGQIDS